MAVKFTNNAATTLAAGINSSVTSIAVTDGSVFPTITGSDHFYVTFDDTTNKEIVKVTARSGNTLTAVRGHDNTTARAFSSGDKAELRIVAALLDDVKTDVSSTLTVDTFTGNGSATAFTLSVAPASEDNLIVFIEGVYQNPGDFALSGTTLTLDVAPANSRKIIVYHVAALVSGNNLTHNQFTCNGSTTAFTLGLSPIHENNTQVFLDGVYQQKTDYAVSGTTLTMDTAPANGAILEVMTFTQTEVNTLPASFVSGLTQVTAVGADHFMIFDATDSALKKSLVSDVLESATSISTSADATAITIDSNEKVTFTSDVTTGGHLLIGGSNNELRFYEGSNYVGFEAPALSADKIWVLPAADGSNGQVIKTDGSGNLSFATISGTTINNNADNRIITGSGTANTLEGEANLRFDGTNLVLDAAGASVSADDVFGAINFFDQDGGSSAAGVTSSIKSIAVGAVGASKLTFSTSTSGGGARSSLTEKMVIDESGNVGIGISSPANALSVVGSGDALKVGNGTRHLFVQADSGGVSLGNTASQNGEFLYLSESASDARIYTDGALRMMVDSSGNVGIGQASDGDKLHVLGTGFFEDSRGNGVGVLLHGGSPSAFAHIGVTASNPFTFQTAGTERMRLTSNGFLHVNGTTSENFHKFTNTTAGEWVATLYNSSSNPFGVAIGYSAVAPTNTTNKFLQMGDSVAARAIFYSNGGLANYQSNNSNLSDNREKKNIVDADAAWDDVKAWDIKKFHYNEESDSDPKRLGVIAQDIETNNPELISNFQKQAAADEVLWTEEDELPEGVSVGDVKTAAVEEIMRKGVKEQQMYWVAIKALQESLTKIEQLEARIETLEG